MKGNTYKTAIILLITATSLTKLTGQAGNSALHADPDLEALFPAREFHSHSHAEPLLQSDDDFSILASTGFLIYKTFISSQDKPSCVFTPSCSEYALESVRQKGIIRGWVSAFDRLQRCHGLVNPANYTFDPETQRLYDPVQ